MNQTQQLISSKSSETVSLKQSLPLQPSFQTYTDEFLKLFVDWKEKKNLLLFNSQVYRKTMLLFLDYTLKEVNFVMNELLLLLGHFDEDSPQIVFNSLPRQHKSRIKFFKPSKNSNEAKKSDCLDMTKACIFKLASMLERICFFTTG